jgi:potassium large conductance calcium-activated channel subfamily M alpha protein 1
LTDLGRLIRYWYFALTTLSSIGYGDFFAKATVEKVIMLLILNFGVAIFAFLMSEFLEIINSRNKLEQ